MKKISFILLLFIVSVTLQAKNNFALNSGLDNDEIILYLGEQKFFPINQPTRIVIGNPDIADIVNVTKKDFAISPKIPGTTTLIYWDASGEHSFAIKVYKENMEAIKKRIDKLLQKLNFTDINTQITEEESKVLLLGSVKTAEDRERALLVLGPMKEQIIDLLVIKEEENVIDIDVQMVEIDKDATNTLGFTWPGSITLTDASTSVSSAVTGLKNVFYVSKFTRTAFNVTLDALAQEGKARILSRPHLACQSGKEAELLVGGEKPILTTTVAAETGAQGTQVEYKEFGIKLNIKPTIREGDKIQLALKMEVSEIGAAEVLGAANAPTAKAYPLSKRNTSTEMFLNNGQTMAISGLIKEKTEEDVRRTPFLSDIPLIGGAFRKKTTKIGGGTGERGNTELFVMLTPTIMPKKNAAKPVEEKPVPKEEVIMQAPEAIPVKREPSPIEFYSSVVQKKIVDTLSYPTDAKDSGFQGTVKLSLHLDYSGKLLDVSIKSSSGHNVLDDSAISTARSISLYPPFPKSIQKQDLWLDVPIEYRLN